MPHSLLKTTTSRFPIASLLVLMLVLTAAPTIADQPQASQKPADAEKDRADRQRAMQPIVDDPNLPRVLLIGDSISIGYTIPTREALDGVANVHRVLTNCGPTTRGLENLDRWLGDQKWDVIHFNWGLHDLKYMGPQNENLADPTKDTSHQQVPPDAYKANLKELVARLKKTNALLIWRNTTPVPQGAKGRIVGDSAAYNQIASEIMKENQIQIQDLYTWCKEHPELFRPKDVHFTAEGNRKLGDQVATCIQKALATRKSQNP